MAEFTFVTIANKGMVSLTKNLIRTIRITGMTNSIVVACTDSETYEALNALENVSLICVEDELTTVIPKKYQNS